MATAMTKPIMLSIVLMVGTAVVMMSTQNIASFVDAMLKEPA